MWRYILRRVIQALICLIGISIIVFMLTRLSGDPALLMARPGAAPEEIEAIRAQLGLDHPLPTQYGIFISHAVRGDFGESFRYKQPALRVWLDRFPNTLQLGGTAFLVGTILSLALGIIAAVKPGSWADNLGRLFAFMGISLPPFWIGLVFIMIFSVRLGWFPVAGMETWQHFVLPVFTMVWVGSAGGIRITRSAMLDVLDSEYIKMARIKGVPEHLVILKHALRNASIPLVTVMGLSLVGTLTGSVIIETIFNWRGIGWLAVEAIFARDFPVVMTCVLLGSSMLIFMNLIIDILYAYIDPRIKYR